MWISSSWGITMDQHCFWGIGDVTWIKGIRGCNSFWNQWKKRKKFLQNLLIYKTHCSPLYILVVIPGILLKPVCKSCRKNEDICSGHIHRVKSCLIPDFIFPLLPTLEKQNSQITWGNSVSEWIHFRRRKIFTN